jgi:hypothetical protein
MGDVVGLIAACVLTGWVVFDATFVTIDSDEISKLNNYCKTNQGVAKVKYTTDRKSKVTCADGAIFEIEGH